MICIEEASIIELQSAMNENQLTCRELVLYYLSRIAEIDKCDCGLNSVIEINPDALFIADKLDSMRISGNVLSLMHGIPVMLKDNISTHDKMHTSAGSVTLGNNYARNDAYIVKLLRENGALIIGKTNMIEFANFMTNDMPMGYSSRGGYTLNPYDKSANPSGSSTGSAVAVSANLCTVAVGTETCGSIISPSQCNGIVGVKPTLGLSSRYGIIPISFTLDTPGPMARSVTDAAILLEIITGKDDNDPATSQAERINYVQYLDENGLDGSRIGISRMFTEEASKEILDILESIITILKQHGAICVELPEHSLRSGENFGAIMKYEFKCGINQYLASFGSDNAMQNLQDIIMYNQGHPEKTLKFGQTTLTDVQNNTSGTLTEPEYIKAIEKREELIREFDAIFTENNVDVIFSLAGTGLPPMTGFPSMTIPVGRTKDNLPLGSYWIARKYDEKMLLRVTYAIEKILKARQNPFA